MKFPSFPILFLGFVAPLLGQVPKAPKSKFFIGPGVTTPDQPRVPFAQQPLTVPGTRSQSSASAVPPPSTGTPVVLTAQQPTSPTAIRSASPSNAPFGYSWMTTPPRPNLIQQAAHSLGPEASDGPGLLRFSAGYVSRRIGASFHVEPPEAGLLAGHLLSGGLGDVGLYRGGDSSTVYEDGEVIRINGNDQGSGTAIFSGGSGQSGGTHLFSQQPHEGDRISLHSHSFSTDTQSIASALDYSESDVGLGYYLRLGQILVERAGITFGLSASFTGLDGHFGTEPRLASRVRSYRTDYRYGYDFAEVKNFNIAGYMYGLVYDSAAANASYEASTGQPGHYAPPSQSSRTQLVSDWRGITHTTLDAHLNELFLSGEASWQPPQLPRLHLGLAAGPTLNVLSTDLRSSASWVSSSTGQQVAGATLHERATTFQLGLGAEARARYDLTPDGRCYLEASAGYKWLQDTRLGGAFATADLDASSWELGLGMGIQLGDWPAGSPWSVSAGATTRRLGASVGPPSLTAIAPYTSGHRGRGDVGFYRIGSGRLDYDDGSIHAYGANGSNHGVEFISSWVTDSSIVNHPGQLRSTGRFDDDSYSISEVDFHSSGYAQNLLSVSSRTVESEEKGIGPYLDIHRDLCSAGTWSIGTTLEWSIVGGRVEADNIIAISAQVHQHGQMFTYTYDVAYGGQNGPDYPAQLDGIVVAPTSYLDNYTSPDSTHPYLNPRKSSAPIDRIVTYIARTSSTLDATLHSLAFSADLGWKPRPRLEFSLSGGPTLNVLHSDLTAVTEWTEVAGAFNTRGQQGRARNGPTTTSTLVARDIQQASSTAVKIGAGLLAHLRYDLTPDGRWYAEARGGYQWLSPVDVGEGNLHATLDASSWDIGGGFGCRLGQGGPCIEAIRQVGHVNLTTTSQPSPKPPGFFGRIREMWIARNLALAAEKKQR